MDPRIRSAARNNAEWCATVAATHGAPGEFHDFIWINRNRLPRFYPNAVTLHETAHHDPTHAIDRIRDLTHADLAPGWTVKDSFDMLDLTSSGFTPLFDAQWTMRNPEPPPVDDLPSSWRWNIIDDVEDLAAWESAWSAAKNKAPGQPRIYLPALLSDRSIAVIGGFDGSQIIAGAIANRGEDVVGLTNLFAPPAKVLACGARVIAIVRDLFPDLPLVSYDRGASLRVSLQLGFEAIGPVRVWVRNS